MSALNVHAVNPYIRVAMPSVLPAYHLIARRVIFDYELVYVESGTLQLRYDDVDYLCRPGQFFLIHPGIPHAFMIPGEDVSQPHIHFDLIYDLDSRKIPVSFRDLDKLSPEERGRIRKDYFEEFPGCPFVCFRDHGQALHLFHSIIEAHGRADALYAKALLTQLLYLLIGDNFPGCLSSPQQTGHTVCRQIRDYIDAGQGLSMSLADFEKQFSYSRFYLERQFKQAYGINLIAYRNQKRLQTACDLLCQYPVSQVGKLLGYASVYSFSRTFKEKFGISPSQWKTAHK